LLITNRQLLFVMADGMNRVKFPRRELVYFKTRQSLLPSSVILG